MTQDELVDLVVNWDDAADACGPEDLCGPASENNSGTPPLEDQLRWIRELTL